VAFGWILTRTGSWTAPFVFSVGLLLFAIVVTYRIRPDRRDAILDGKDQDIVFTPQEIELELTITFKMGVEAGGGFKLLTFVDLSTEATTSKILNTRSN
jgi:Trypsin-co-occurring domain 2